MKCRAYCILPDRDCLRSVMPRSLEDAPLAVIVEEGLACVYAPVSDTVAAPAVSHLLEYARIIENLAQHFPLLPMRYGSVLDSEDQLRDLLRRRHVAFRACLEKLEGCGEMSIRVLPDVSEEGPEPCPVSEPQPRSGTAYLAARRASYQADEQKHQQAIRLCGEILAQFQGLFRTARTEQSTVQGRFLVSLHFLVPQELIEPFRAAVHRFQQTSLLKVLLSGPWPPYHFADCD